MSFSVRITEPLKNVAIGHGATVGGFSARKLDELKSISATLITLAEFNPSVRLELASLAARVDVIISNPLI